MQPYAVTAKDLATKVSTWPKTAEPVTVSFEYLCYNAKVPMIRDYRGPMLICRCGCAVRGLVEHPGGRGLVCADCYRRVQQMFEHKAERATGGLQNARKPVKQPASKPKRGKPITLPGKPTKTRKTPARKAA